MKKSNLIVTLATLGALTAASTAQADSGFYVGGQVGGLNATTTQNIIEHHNYNLDMNKDGSAKANFKNDKFFTIKGGYDFNDYIGVELRHSFHTDTHSTNFKKEHGDLSISMAIKGQTAIYAKGMLPVTDSFNLYALAGANNVMFKQLGQESDKKSITGFSYGVGAQYKLTQSFAVNLEMVKLSSSQQFDANAINLGVSYKF